LSAERAHDLRSRYDLWEPGMRLFGRYLSALLQRHRGSVKRSLIGLNIDPYRVEPFVTPARPRPWAGRPTRPGATSPECASALFPPRHHTARPLRRIIPKNYVT
jgi:hypothetical protein